jgi:AIPR protein
MLHRIYRRSLTRRPKLSITYCYAKLGESEHPKVTARRGILVDKCRGHFSAADVECQPVGAAILLAYYNKVPSTTILLTTMKSISLSAFGTSYLCLVSLSEFYNFITENGVLRAHIFEANVRDFQGNVAVNNQIGVTLTVVENEEFWWLNNGVTILCETASNSGDIVYITDPLIVNGLQTSFVIFNHFSRVGQNDTRNILVRVIRPNDAQSIDKIIKATNSQTQIPPIWLHSTEDIHKKSKPSLKLLISIMTEEKTTIETGVYPHPR